MPRGILIIVGLLAILAMVVVGIVVVDSIRPSQPAAPSQSGTVVKPAEPPIVHFPNSTQSGPGTIGAPTDGGTRFPAISTVGTSVGSLLPDGTFSDVTGGSVTLSSYRGNKAVLLMGWDSLCNDCTKELLALADVQEDFRSALAVIVLTRMESVASVRGEMDRLNLTSKFTVVIDPVGTYWAGLGNLPFPFTFFVDSRGVIVHKETTVLTISLLRAFLLQFLGLTK